MPASPTPIPLDEATAVLARVAAIEPGVLEDDDLHLRAVRALEVLHARGLPIVAERFVPLVALEEDAANSLLDLFVTLLAESDRTAAAVAGRAQTVAGEVRSKVSPEAALAHAVRAVLIDPARRIGSYLPRSIALLNDFRREELVRAWASAIGAPVSVRDAVEPPKKSARALDKLDYRKIRADEERLSIERRVLAEHAERVRQRQRQRDAEALASAQRE